MINNYLHFTILVQTRFDVYLNENDYPAFANLITTFKTWDKRGDADSKGAAIFLLAYEYLKKTLQGQAPRAITKQEAVETFSI